MFKKMNPRYMDEFQAGLRYLANLRETSPITRLKEKIAEIRTYLAPFDDQDFMQTTSYDDILAGGAYSGGEERNTLNPAPYELFKRATAGFLSFHHTPHDKFFSSKVIVDRELDPESARQVEEYLRFRDERAHQILQHPHNVAQEALFILDRLIFNIGIKVLDPDEDLVMKKTTFPVESLILESSDGRSQDIVGVWEDLTWFQFRLRYPKPLHMVEASEQNKKIFELRGIRSVGAASSKDVRIFRFNMMIPAFKAFFEAYFSEDAKLLGQFRRDMRGKFPPTAKYVDFSFTEKGELLEFAVREYKTIIVSHLSFVTMSGLRGKGQGDLSLSTAKCLQEAEEILMNAYERSFGPSWALPSELESKAYQSLGRDEIIYADQTEGIRPLTVNYDLRTAKELILSWEQRLEKLAFLDIFTLIDKSRMPTTEIAMRRSDGFRQLGLYVTADTAYNLEPEVTATMKIDQERNRIQPLDVGGSATMRVNYVSPIIQSIKQSALEGYRALNQTFSEMAPIMAQPNPITQNVNYGAMVDRILQKTDNLDLVISEEEKQARMEEEARMRQLEIEKRSAEANAANAQALQAFGGGADEPRPEGGEAGGAPAGAGGAEAGVPPGV